MTTARHEVATLQQSGIWKAQRFETDDFVLFGLLRESPVVQPVLHVYIEGDGYAWIDRHTPSNDPTPLKASALQLAKADSGIVPVLYLARPCQYVQGKDFQGCDEKYWTSARLGKQVIHSLDQAIRLAQKRTGTHQLKLIGFSGGGGAAALLASRRSDVVFLGTVAGNLDTDYLMRWHKVAVLTESLNPMHVAPRLKQLKQLHVSSLSDRVVPPEISRRFCTAVGQPDACRVVSGLQHHDDWEGVWREAWTIKKDESTRDAKVPVQVLQ